VELSDIVSIFFTGLGVVFFIAGTVGLVRFPDVYTRLHALTKADNIGLGMVTLGLAVKVASIDLLFKLILIWLVILFSSATCGYLIAFAGIKMQVAPWKKQ